MFLPPISTIVAIEPMSMVYDPRLPCPSNTTSIQKILQETFLSPHITIYQTIPLPNHLHRISTLHLSNNIRLILKLPPSTTTPVLRHERHSLASEAAILTHLSNQNLPIPHLVTHDPRSNNPLGSPFILTTHLLGIPFLDAYTQLTHSEIQDVEQQLVELRSHISSYASSMFGPAATVGTGAGHSAWREAFGAMTESILMDGEDMTVNLPYAAIREAVSAWGSCLEAVREASLVVPRLGRRENFRIERRTCDVVGLLGFGDAVWGDVAFGGDETACEVKKELL